MFVDGFLAGLGLWLSELAMGFCVIVVIFTLAIVCHLFSLWRRRKHG